ncbi:hypothetical protein GQ44DRAFT_765574 [Phaeosphaeriaceae sp. PMI808]|nr:hypothetical protein GQ44DRAFT_765574 [Phaeosphaeriaceae sp. PMI808]
MNQINKIREDNKEEGSQEQERGNDRRGLDSVEESSLPPSFNRIFHLETMDGAVSYIKQSSWWRESGYSSVESIETITKGSTNYIYKLTLRRDSSLTATKNVQETVVLKHAPGYLLATPGIEFSGRRQVYEAAAMETLPRVLTPEVLTPAVTLPTLILHDPTACVIVMQDLSLPKSDTGRSAWSERTIELTQFCSEAMTPSRMQLVREIGTSLGRFIYQLHFLASQPEESKNTALKDLCELCATHQDARRVAAELIFGNFLRFMDSAGVRLTEQERRTITDVFDREKVYLTDTLETLVMGDFMYGALFFVPSMRPQISAAHWTDKVGKSPDECAAAATIYVLDWEFVTFAPAYIDLAHFAGEAWLYDCFGAPSEAWSELASSVFNAYRNDGGTIDMQRVVYYIAGHIGGSTESFRLAKGHRRRKSAARAAANMILDASRENWQALRQDKFLKALLGDLFVINSIGQCTSSNLWNPT